MDGRCRGKINPAGAVSDITIAKGKALYAATDAVNYVENLKAAVPTITDISVDKKVDISFGGKSFASYGIPNDGKNWKFRDDVHLGDTSAVIVNDKGNTATVTFSPAATFEMPKGQDLDEPVDGITKGSVTAQYPLTITIDGKNYTAIAMDKDMTTSNLTIKHDGAVAGSNTITMTDGNNNDITFTLSTPLQQTLGVMQVNTAAASTNNPVTITYSDGTTAVQTAGSYKVGNSLPVATTATVYDKSGATYDVPIYFIREAGQSGANKWLVSLSPDASVSNGQAITANVTDKSGKKVPVSFAVTEIEFDTNGDLVINLTSATVGTLTLGDKKVLLDFNQ